MEKKVKIRSLTLFVCLGSFLAGCASVPPQNAMLENATSEYDYAIHNSEIRQAAPNQLQKASVEIKKASALLEEGAPGNEVDHYAYMATERIAIAKKMASTNMIEAKIKAAGSKREKLLLDSKQEKISNLRLQLLALKDQKSNQGVILTLGNVLFSVDRAELKSGAVKNLDKLAQFMRNAPKRNVIIEGYAYNTGSGEYNDTLSRRRAESVREVLLNDGINPERMRIRGLGSRYPVATDKTSAGRQANRRVEIIVSDKNGRFSENR
ncbi:MAG: OmpA family protein [Leptospirillum sp.]|jgi:outer membrane protein OmpA-like peptidoglycan-associated protein|nr:OmpA family protein [Nitrospiraceae bacterium]